MTIEIVDFPIETGGSVHDHVKLPEDKSHKILLNHPIQPSINHHFPMVFLGFPRFSYGFTIRGTARRRKSSPPSPQHGVSSKVVPADGPYVGLI